MATDDYVPVSGDDWYQRRREDAEGKFFRSVADQGPRKGEGGSTRQGIYCLTADGKLLAYKNAGQAPDVMREVLKQGLAEWRKLPDSRRKPGAVQVGDAGKIDGRFARTPPPGGLIINVHARCLDRDAKGELCDAACEKGRGDEASRDHLWLTEAEWRSLVPTSAKKGESIPLPEKIADRICRFHLLDNTRGEPNLWSREEVRSREITLTVGESTQSGVLARLEGSALMATHADPSRAERGYDVRLLGYIHFDAAQKAIDRFDLVAAGDHWGEGNYTRGARPGRTPLGVAFELASGKSPADRVPPQAARDIGEYLPR